MPILVNPDDLGQAQLASTARTTKYAGGIFVWLGISSICTGATALAVAALITFIIGG